MVSLYGKSTYKLLFMWAKLLIRVNFHFIQWLTADHLSHDEKAVAGIEKITIADPERLSDSWLKTQIPDGLNGANIEFIDPSTNEGESGIVAVDLIVPSGVVTLD